MQSDYQNEQKYLRAKEKVDKMKGLYANLISYVIIIPFLIFINLRFVPQFHWFWFPIFGWGMGLTFHAMDVFKYNPFLGRGWEDKKIKELMDEDKKNNNWN
jgi:two-component system LytT family sensor kinase